MKLSLNYRVQVLGLVLALMGWTIPAGADEKLSPEEQAFFDKNISSIVQIVPTKLTNADVTKVFSASIYKVQVIIKSTDGSSSQDIQLVRDGDKLVSHERPSSDTEQADIVKLISTKFTLKTDDDAKALQKALDAIEPIIDQEGQKAEGFSHKGNSWTFYRGVFFDKKLGYVFEVNAGGTITSAKFLLKLPG